jgi:hypothetical protein
VSVTDAMGHELQAALLAGLTVAALRNGWHVVLAPRAAVGGSPIALSATGWWHTLPAATGSASVR